MLKTQTEEAIAELAARGLVNSDSFSGLRGLLIPSNRRRPLTAGRRRRRRADFGLDDAGRWASIPHSDVESTAGDRSRFREPNEIEQIAWVLLRRYGVVFKRLLAREHALPPWRDLLRALRPLEARGEFRGGRFVAGFAGEQFALPEAVGALRDTRRRPADPQTVGWFR